MKWADMFEDSGFEVYETSVRLNCEDENIEGPDRHILQMREVLNTIKVGFLSVFLGEAIGMIVHSNVVHKRPISCILICGPDDLCI